jgi:hypothetical protein
MSKITFEEAAAKAIEFRNDRDWKQFGVTIRFPNT